MDDKDVFGPKYLEFEQWYNDNLELVNDLQTWLFYAYAVAEGKVGVVESYVSVPDITVFLELFYLSSKQGNTYSFSEKLSEMVEILQTDDDVVLDALKSLAAHEVIVYSIKDGVVNVQIIPVGSGIARMNEHHDHSHDHNHHDHNGHHHDHDHNDHNNDGQED